MLLLVMGAAFLGYVLPWGQMSYWGATVITNLISAVPYIGVSVVEWLWGGFSVGGATLSRFYSLHFLLPIVVSVFTLVHVYFLHEKGRRCPLGVTGGVEKIPFHRYFVIKDLVGVCVLFFGLLFLVLFYPYLLGDPENFIRANPMVTPVHIQPEWYFLFAYAMLRSVPNKLGGVVALVMGILVLLVCCFWPRRRFRSTGFYPFSGFLFWCQVIIFLLLTWVGSCPAEPPFIVFGQVLTGAYFSWFLLFPVRKLVWDGLLKFLGGRVIRCGVEGPSTKKFSPEGFMAD